MKALKVTLRQNIPLERKILKEMNLQIFEEDQAKNRSAICHHQH